ncbi:FAD:protein FMN transferase [Bizionia sediminis]|uniref:FAD:protein FMN transferase n=1 Tax=Bizionia sediminis TaxID=1737064 RepID=A0ABW5KST1_9FLAO
MTKFPHFFYLFTLVFLAVSCQKEPKNTKIQGSVFGTTYSVIYHDDTNYQKEFDSLFMAINNSMSTYIPNSDISKLNRNETNKVDHHFMAVYETAKAIHQETNGAFDPTIGAVVNAWDFGPEGGIVALDSLKIDSLMQGVGLHKVHIVNNRVNKLPETYIDFNAIAKGYGVDVIGEFLERHNVSDYLVEIGGEIRARGLNKEKDSPWRVGVETPNFNDEHSVFKAISITNGAMATSGTYRKFKIDNNGNRYSHIIDTKTGYPSKTNVLSVSVIANNCMTADAYATAFEAMGVEKTEAFLKNRPNLKAFLIFENDNNELETLSLNNFPDN